ncbi:HTH-type transcriptional regulator BhcR [Shimia abyssi]|uniref:IclR family transcriptional regulator n=1 Tax=Shimia abyssi TaxID=1662395 RepID=A0A2P8FBZ9_9RHOB|nr:HTH-type transcriptional regulator BhcR [Shimia abyssi]PSL19202.1 IclR family transcriptional regulator [Shimia abyssi]
MSSPPRQRGRPKSFHSKQAQNTIQSLDRAIDVLEHLAQHGSQTLTEISTSMEQSPATIYRVLTTFEARGLVETEGLSQVWAIGPATFRIGSSFLRRTSLVERARPAMRSLMETTGETANLGIRTGANVIFISQVETHHSIRAFFPPGTISAIHASGIGKALLSAMSEESVRELLKRSSLEAFTRNTMSDLDALCADLQISRDRGFALDDEERTEGMRCIAAPIRDLNGDTVAGVSISGPSHRMKPSVVKEFGTLVKTVGENLSSSLGAP